YEVLSDPSSKWIYDQHFLSTPEAAPSYFATQASAPTTTVDPRKTRRGTRETEEQKQRRKIFAKLRNTLFNRKMRIFSYISLFFSSLIFLDHYLPPTTSYKKVYAPFRAYEANVSSNEVLSVFLSQGRKLDMSPVDWNEEAIGLLSNEGFFNETRI